jgi:hypothetical protein
MALEVNNNYSKFEKEYIEPPTPTNSNDSGLDIESASAGYGSVRKYSFIKRPDLKFKLPKVETNALDMMQNSSIIYHTEPILETQTCCLIAMILLTSWMQVSTLLRLSLVWPITHIIVMFINIFENGFSFIAILINEN